MKKFLTIASLAITVASGFSQGTVSFNNNVAFATAPSTSGGGLPSNGHDDRLVYGTDNVTKLVGTNWVAQLYFAAGAGQSEGSLNTISGDTFSKFRVTTTATPGTWSGGTKTLTGVPVGATATLQVRVWDGSLFSTWSLASQAALSDTSVVLGKSATFNYTAPDTSNPNTPLDAQFMYGLQSFTLTAAPEPSTIALGILGAVSLLVVRRRK